MPLTPVVVTTTNDAGALAAACIGDGIELVPASAVYSGNALASGTYSGGDAAGLTLGSAGSGAVPLLDTGIILTNGKASDAQSKVGASNSDVTSTNLGAAGASGDTTTLTFSFIPSGTTLYVPFIFGSEEYTEFVGTPFNDAISVKLDGSNIALIPGTSTPISINTVYPSSAQDDFGHEEYYQGRGADFGTGNVATQTIAYDGLVTVNLTASVTPGVVHTLEISVADVSDGNVDSAILIGIATSVGISTEVEVEGTIPLTWVERTDSSGAVHVSAMVALPDPATYYHGYKSARVLQWGTVRRALSDDQGQYEGSEFTWTESDADRVIRGQLASTTSPTTRYFPNRPIVTRMIADEDRRALRIPRVIFRGLIRDYRPGSPLTFSFTGRDYFDALFSATAEAQQIPKRLITTDDFPEAGSTHTVGEDLTVSPNLPGTEVEIAAVDLPVPIIYGAITDTYDPGGGDAGDGQCPAIYVGDQTISATLYHKFLIAGHACKSIDEIYVNNDPQNIGSDPGMSDVGGVWLIPGYPGWTAEFGAPLYEDINGRRYTVVYGKSGEDGPDTGAGLITPVSVPLAFTVQGIEDVGDGTGDLITDAFSQYLHCLQNWVIGNYQAGAWLASPTFPDDPDLLMIDEDSFTTASDTAWLRISGGYRGDFIIGATAVGPGGSRVGGERITARELIARFNQSFDVQSGFNRKTRFFVSLLDEFSDVSETRQVTDVAEVVKDSLEIRDDVQRLWNIVPYRHTRDYMGRMGTTDTFGKGKTDTQWRSLQVASSIQDDNSISNYSADPAHLTPFTAPNLLLHMIRGRNRDTDAPEYEQGSATAADVVQRFLARHKDPPRLVTWRTGIDGMNIELGEIVRLTHFAGIGSSGWTDRCLRVVRHEADPERLIVTLTAEDIQQILDEA